MKNIIRRTAAVLLAVILLACPSAISALTRYTKTDTDAPEPPTVDEIFSGGVTLTATADTEYSIDGENWQRSNVFTGLETGKDYYFYARKCDTETQKISLGSTASEKVNILLYGDVNSDGKVDNSDLIRMKKYFAGVNVAVNRTLSDLKYDNEIDSRDLVRMKKYIAGQNVVLHRDEPQIAKEERELFVFAGQSNMVGAAALEPTDQIYLSDSYEYLHKAKRFGANAGTFKSYGYPCGEFSYINLSTAYPDLNDAYALSTLTNYSQNCYFSTSMSNATGSGTSVNNFSVYSEATAKPAPSLAPILMKEWEKLGHKSAYAHIAKGSTSGFYYFNQDMIAEYNRKIAAYNKENGTSYSTSRTLPSGTAAKTSLAYFDSKVNDFFRDSETYFPNDDLSTKAFVWLQGETDAALATAEYKTLLEVLWGHMKSLGFTHFFCIRIGFWAPEKASITNVMKAQEEFCNETEDAYMLTRALSFMQFPNMAPSTYYTTALASEYQNCRDSFAGYGNHHINQKGHTVIAEHAVPNLERVLKHGLEPQLETEIVKALK